MTLTKKISKEDVLVVAKSIQVTMSATQINNVLELYDDELELDPDATWNLVTEHCIRLVLDSD